MRVVLKILKWLVIVVVVLALVTGIGGYVWLRGALPQTSGTIKTQGISGPVEILRDTDGVPHISAANDKDAMFGLGYAHAQDRLWQMEFQRRIGAGRLSEILGAPTVETDKFLRTLGAYRAARTAWPKVTSADRGVIEAYVAGVNAFISTHHGRQLPIEFTLLGFEPEPWAPEDVLVWAKMMSFNLSGNWNEELVRSEMVAKIGADKTAQITRGYTDDGPLILPSGSATTGGPAVARRDSAPTPAVGAPSYASDLLAINHTIEDALGLGGFAIGSNNWVIGGAHTATGKPFVANDPHLGFQIPSIWYLAHVTGGPYDVIGATLPGLPSVVIGHNQRIGWAVTNTGPDVQDLFMEHVNDRNEVEHNGKWEPMQIVPEVIKVKGQPDMTIQVRITRHGPLISDATDNGGLIKEPMAFRWTSLDPEDHTIEAFLSVNRAQNWDDFTKALSLYEAPMQNFVFADVDNNIGYYAPGALPIRAKGDGSMPAPGWTDEYDWTGYVPFDKLPHSYNPPEGFIVTANNKVTPASYPYFITNTWSAPYRAERITEMIQAKPKLTIDDVAAMQADVVSTQARRMLPYLLQATPPDDASKAALDMLKGWDATIRGDSAQAAVYEAWFNQIGKHIFADELGDKVWGDYSSAGDFDTMQLPDVLAGKEADWCDNATTPQKEDCAVTSGLALKDGLAEMAKYQGSSDPKSWRWDKVHRATFPHNPLDNVGPLKSIFSRSIPNGGDNYTVDVGSIRTSALYNQYHGPSYREILDLSDLNNSRFIHTVGQSGYVLSGNYSNFIERWQHVQYIPMRFNKDTINGAADGRLTLEP